MGSGRWSTSIYDARKKVRAASGKSAFDYSDCMHSAGRSAWRVHPNLDPLGVKLRESCDSAEHPQSLSIAVLFDVTGSMGQVPVTLQKKLPQLLGLLLRKGYVTDPQILFGAIGDATCDQVPLQVGQFESDNRMDENLENIFLEGGGGGQRTESYELAMYFIARHTDIDCWNRRGRQGYLFIIGDEMAYPSVNRHEVKAHIGDSLERDIPLEGIVNELKKRYHVFYILPKSASYGGDSQILRFWRDLLGQNVLELEQAEAVCEIIALTIGMTEGTIDLQQGTEDLKEYNLAPEVLRAVTVALATLPASVERVQSGAKLLPGSSPASLPAGPLKRI